MFTEQQLEVIKSVARKKKNQGEISVWKALIELPLGTFTGPQVQIIQYCAEECKRQHSGEMSVYDMLVAWNWMAEHNKLALPDEKRTQLNLQCIETLGTLVEPIDNRKGFRTIPIGVTDGRGGWIEKAQYAEVPRLLEHLLNSYYEGHLEIKSCTCGSAVSQHMSGCAIFYNVRSGGHELAKTPEDQFYFEYENIHPFVDGNGRSGKILYNYLLGRLDDPIMPPNFWNIGNP